MSPTETIPHPGTPDNGADGEQQDRNFRPPRYEISGFMLRWLRVEMGLLEGDALSEAFEAILRDNVIGELLVTRHGICIGQDGDRLYMRRAEAVTDGRRHYVGRLAERRILPPRPDPSEAPAETGS